LEKENLALKQAIEEAKSNSADKEKFDKA